MTIQVGIIGAGIMGEAHAKAYRKAGVPLVGVYDIDRARAEALASQFDCQAFASPETLCHSNVDAVSICLPHNLHRDIAVRVASWGKHILMEKPLATTLADAEAIIQGCGKAGVKLMVGYTQRFLKTLQTVKAQIDSGRFGQIHLVVDYLAAGGSSFVPPAWYRQKAMAGGGIMMIGNIHSVDRIRWLLNSEVKQVFALKHQYASEGDVEDVGTANLLYESGVQASIIGYRSGLKHHQRRHTLEIYGTHAEASISVSYSNEQILEITDANGIQIMKEQDDDPFFKEITEFISAIQDNRPPLPNGKDGWVSLKTILAMYESASKREPIFMDRFGMAN